MPNMMLTYWYQLYKEQTVAERLLEKYIARLGVRYRCQHPLLSVKAILDFYLPDYNLVIEVDDPSHFQKKGIKKDQERTKRLTGLGLKVVRYTNAEVLSSPEWVASNIAKILESLVPVLDVDSAALCMSSKQPRTPKKPRKKKVSPLKSSQELMSFYQLEKSSLA